MIVQVEGIVTKVSDCVLLFNTTRQQLSSVLMPRVLEVTINPRTKSYINDLTTLPVHTSKQGILTRIRTLGTASSPYSLPNWIKLDCDFYGRVQDLSNFRAIHLGREQRSRLRNPFSESVEGVEDPRYHV